MRSCTRDHFVELPGPAGRHAWSWWWKLLFTAVTLGSGFKGGEVTPLFFIGAALGNTLAAVLFGAPVELFAALGFVAVFAGATNTPLACTIMAVELFGTQHLVYYAVACFIAYLFSGHSGIYLSQARVAMPKGRITARRFPASHPRVRAPTTKNSGACSDAWHPALPRTCHFFQETKP